MSTLARDDAHVDRLRIRGGSDPMLSRLRAESLLSAVELRPPGLPPAAILCVRALADPLPGVLPLHTASARPPRAWAGALTAALERLVRSAAQPAHASVPSAAEAVLFADRAELLACLAVDLLEGSLHARWWWRSLVPALHRLARGEPAARVVAAAFCHTPEYVPAALARLATQGLVGRFVRVLSTRDQHAILAEVIERFAAPNLAAALHREVEPPGHHARASAAAAVPRSWEIEDAPAPPWLDLVPEAVDPGLLSEAQCLLGIGLMLARALHVARGSGFAAQTAAWLSAEISRRSAAVPSLVSALSEGLVLRGPLSPRPDPALPEAERSASPSICDRPAPDESRSQARLPHYAAEPSPKRDSIPVAAQEMSGTETRQSTALPSPMASELPAARPPVAIHTTAPRAASEAAAEALSVPPASTPSEPLRPSANPPTRQPATRARRQLGPALSTQLGGLFYLLNAARLLKLYDSGETPTVSLWDFVIGIGWRLLADAVDARDPLWWLLTELAGHRVPDPPPSEFKPAPIDPAGQDCLQHWLPAVIALLCQALDLDDPQVASQCVLCHRARVHVTASRLDIVFSLAELPVRIRLAGLDRDPGFLPAGGRVIAFHFE